MSRKSEETRFYLSAIQELPTEERVKAASQILVRLSDLTSEGTSSDTEGDLLQAAKEAALEHAPDKGLPTRYGAVIVFKPMSRADCGLALEKLSDFIDWDYFCNKTEDSLVQDFDPELGGPVWYCP